MFAPWPHGGIATPPPPPAGGVLLVHTERDTINITASSASSTLITLVARAQDNEAPYFGAGNLYAGHFYARIDGVLGIAPLIRVTTQFMGGVLSGSWSPWYSYNPADPNSWVSLPTYSTSGTYIEITTPTFTQDTVYVSAIPVMRPSDWVTYIASFATASPPVTTAQTDELGQTVPSLSLLSGILGTGPKKMVLTSGMHAYEDGGDLAMRGAIAWLQSHSAALSEATWYIYPQINPSGRYGGHWRGCWDPSKPLYDPNRHWNSGSDALDCVIKMRARIVSETGGGAAIRAFWDSHCNNNVGGGYGLYVGGSAGSNFLGRFSTAYPGAAVDGPISGMGCDWAILNGALLGIATEISWQQKTAADYASYGASIVSMLYDMVHTGVL